MNFQEQILEGLNNKFRFRKAGKGWLQEGECPDCKRWEAFCAADEPKVVRCGRQDNCGWEDSVRNLLPDLFENWSDRFKITPERPNASADAYLEFERGLDLKLLQGSYSQELYRDQDSGATSATVRFRIGDTHWERLIDRTGRFDKKAHFKAGGGWRGHCWIPPRWSIDDLATADDVWINEGIFDAAALAQVGKHAVSAMSANVWPEIFLADLRAAIDRAKRVTRPRLVFAFDVGRAGVEWTRKFVDRARKEGWEATAAQVRPDGEGTKLDWNDLLLRHLKWQGDDPDDAPLSLKSFETYLWNGAVTIAKTPREKAKLIADERALASFDFRHGNRLWWARIRYDEEKNRSIDVDEIANCAFRLLYRERDEISDETNYFLQIDFPHGQPTVKARFSASACANSGEFKKRLMAFAGMWAGSGDQLDRLMRNQTRQLKVVEPIYFTGYSHPHQAYILGDVGVREGRLVKINRESYFDFGKAAVKPRSTERLLDITYDPDRLDFDWLEDVWIAWGPKGFVGLAFWVMSLFAVQIRLREKSIGFLEITGEPGSGKSTMVEFFWKMLGRGGYEGFDPNKATPAFIARSLVKVSNLPVGLVEGKRDEEKGGYRRFDYDDLLVLFNGRSPRGTGQKSNGYETSEPPFLGTIYLVQNERIDAIPAVLERLMSMSIDKAGRSAATREAAIRLEQWPIERVSGTIVHIVRKETPWLAHYFKRSAFHEADMRKRIDGLHNDRIIKNHRQLAAAVETLPKLFPTCRADWIEQTLAFVDAMALDRQQSTGGDHPKVGTFWDRVEWLLARENADHHETGRSINQHRDRANLIAINLVDFEARCRSAGLATPDMDELRRLLRGSKSRKWIATKKVNNPVGDVRACWVFQQPVKGRDEAIE